MEARRSSSSSAEEVVGEVDALGAHVPRRDSGIRARELASGTALTSERATVPPPGRGRPSDPSIHVARIHLHTSMDELLYRLAVGDWEGAYRANVELVHLVPHVVAPRSELEATELDYLQEYVLACVDGVSTWGDLVSGAPFEPAETLRALSALVDLGLVGCL